MKKPFKMLVLIGLFLSYTACNDQLENISTKTHENILKFDSVEDFKNVTDKIPGMTPEEFSNWEKTRNFTSYRSILKEAYEELDSINTEEERNAFIDKYKDILSYSEDHWTPKIQISLYQSIANREGIYETNGYLNKVTENLIITVKKEDYDKLNKLKDLDYHSLVNKSSKSEGLTVFQYTGSSPSIQARTLLTPCGTDMTTSYFLNSSKCKDDRKVFINARSYIASYSDYRGDWRQPRVSIKVWGERRKGTWCNWIRYFTALSYRNVAFSIYAWENHPNGTSTTKLYSRTLPNYAPTDDRNDLIWDQSIGDPVLNEPIVANPFQVFHGEGSSRGVNNNWAVLDCTRIY